MMPDDTITIPDMPQRARLHSYFGAWLIEPQAAHGLYRASQRIDWPQHFEQFDDAERSNDKSMPLMVSNGVAIITINGTMMKHESSMDESTSTVMVRRAVRRSMRLHESGQVKAMVVIVDSPGGTASGTEDLAQDIRAAAELMPVWGYVDDLTASAGLYAIAYADRIVAGNDTAMIGSIGTIFAFYDFSEQAKNEGIKPIVITSAGAEAFKGMGFPGTEITDEQRAYLRDLANQNQIAFDRALTTGRGFTAEQLAAVKTGQVWHAPDALKLGLIDAIQPLDSVIDEILTAAESRTSQGRMTMGETNPNQEQNQAATLAELKAACFGADAEFLMAQVEAGATVAKAQAEFITALQAKIEGADAKLAELTASHAAELDKIKAANTEALAAAEQKATDAETKMAQVQAGIDPDKAPAADGSDGKGEKRGIQNAIRMTQPASN